jgi:subtilase family serine protease
MPRERFEPLRVLARAKDDGPVAGDASVALSVSLPVAKPAELQAYVDAVSDPRSPTYRRFLAPDETGPSTRCRG